MKYHESYGSHSLPGTSVNGFNSLPMDTQFKSVVNQRMSWFPQTPPDNNETDASPQVQGSQKEPPKKQKHKRPHNHPAKDCRPPSLTFCNKDIYKEEAVGLHTEPAQF